MAQTLTASRSGTMSFAAMREQERVAEAANIGPGSFDGYAQSHAFGQHMAKGTGFGSKYETKYNANPGPGEYDTVSPTRHTKERKYEAMIFKYDDKERKKPGEASPEPGAYQAKTITFGEKMNKVGFGSKYKFDPGNNPAPGQYEPNVNMIKPASKGGKIHQPTTSYKRPEEQLPEPGQYQAETVTFAKGMKKVDFGRKYEFKVDSNPRVG